METSNVVEISSGESDIEEVIDRRAIFQPVISRVVDALGGYEGGKYRMGDEVTGCLKDLKKLWRKDDTDDERTVARIMWETRVLTNDLIPILLATAGSGLVEDKRAILCADLMTAMTWPIDMAEELRELDEELDKGTDYTQLMESHLHYKAALLKPGVMQAIFGIVLPPLSKPVKERNERDGQIINVVLHLVRNLSFIKDLPFNARLSSDQAGFSSLQAKLIAALSETHMFQLLLTIAANTEKDPLLNSYNTVVLEIFYLLFRGIKPTSLSVDQAKQPTEKLQRLLAAEQQTRRELARNATSRHSRFGTTIAVTLNPNKKHRSAEGNEAGNVANLEAPPATTRPFVLHHQQAITSETGSIMDMKKRSVAKRSTKVDELTREDNLSVEARAILQNLAIEFVEACFNPFLSVLLKDIRSERVRVTEKDNVRLLFITKWFLEFFLVMRSREEEAKGGNRWNFGLIAEVTERTWIIWVLKRMREAVEEKPKQWTELQTGIECLTQLLLLIDKMSWSDITDPVLKEASEILQQQLIYNGEVLDIAFESLRSYKTGTQSLAYLDSSIYLSYALLRMLEKWSKGKGDVYVRKKKKKRNTKPAIGEEDGIPDVEEPVEEQEDVIHETIFTFEAFEMKFAHADITNTLLIYLARYEEFSSPQHLQRVVSLMHRQAVRVKAEGLFFKASTLHLFKTILAKQRSFPRDKPYKDLVNLITFILRQFFKALTEDPLLAVEAFFPKNRGQWKQYSSWEPEQKKTKAVTDTKFPAEIQVKKGYSWSDQLGIVIASLVDAEEKELVLWTSDILTLVSSQRQRIVDETDKNDGEPDDNMLESTEDDQAAKVSGQGTVSAEAMAKMTDYSVPYLSDDQANAATRNPKLKLLFRLSKFLILDPDADELQWYIPAHVVPAELRRILAVINQFLETPLDLEGKKISDLLRKQRRQRRRRSPSLSSDGSVSDGGEIKRKKRKERKKKEKEQYKSAQFIEDSDEEYGDIEAFLEKEKALRERTEKVAEASGGTRVGTMKMHGTKRRRKKMENTGGSKKHKGDLPNNTASKVTDGDSSQESDAPVDGAVSNQELSSSPSSSNPRSRIPENHSQSPDSPIRPQSPFARPKPRPLPARRKRLVLSDEEDD